MCVQLDVEEEGSHQLRVRLLQMLPNSAPLDLREKILPASECCVCVLGLNPSLSLLLTH